MKGSKAEGQLNILAAVRAVVVGAVSGAAVCAGLLAVCTLAFVSSENIPHHFLPILIIAVSVVSSFFAGFITAKVSKQAGLLLGTMAGLLLFLFFLLAGLAVSQSGLAAEAFPRFLMMLLAGGVGGLIAVNSKSRRK